jgi:hypothetical protein
MVREPKFDLAYRVQAQQALRGERHVKAAEHVIELAGASERTARIAAVEALAGADWSQDVEEERAGLRVLSAEHDEWRGQVVRSDTETVCQSLFCDVTA